MNDNKTNTPENTQCSRAAGHVKRKTCLCQKPISYEVKCDKCRGGNTTWSEYEHMIWCFDCEIDTPGTGGIFDGPIAPGSCAVLGISLDKIRISDGKLLKFMESEGRLTWAE